MHAHKQKCEHTLTFMHTCNHTRTHTHTHTYTYIYSRPVTDAKSTADCSAPVQRVFTVAAVPLVKGVDTLRPVTRGAQRNNDTKLRQRGRRCFENELLYCENLKQAASLLRPWRFSQHVSGTLCNIGNHHITNYRNICYTTPCYFSTLSYHVLPGGTLLSHYLFFFLEENTATNAMIITTCTCISVAKLTL